VGAVLRHLREHPGWLLILDNVDTEDAASAVCALLPSLNGGRVLLTSRLSEWPATVQQQPLETLETGEAVRFLLQRTDKHRGPEPDDPVQAERLATLLDGLPLALEQAAAYINHHHLRFEDYLKAWEREREAILSWFNPRLMSYPAPVATTWKTTFDRLGPTAGAILRLTAFLAPDPLHIEMFETGEDFVRQAAQRLAKETKRKPDAVSISGALGDLAAFSMITHLEGRRFSVHRMVQEAMRGQIPAKRRRDWIELSLKVVNRFSPFEPDDVRTWPVWDPLRPHAAVIVATADASGITDPTRAVEIVERSLGGDHPTARMFQRNLAILLERA
jgi:hypothetical protein